MDRKRTIVVGLLLASSLVLSGCKKKKPPVPPPQAQAPTITDSSGVPSTIPEVTVPQPAPEPEPSKPSPSVTKKNRPRAPRSDAKKTPPATTQPPATSPSDKDKDKVVIEGGKQDPGPPPLTADTSHDDATRLRLNTNQLITAAEYNINNVHRTLSADEQAIVQHIRSYIEQSRQALKDADNERAYNLAVKAHLLSDSLAKK
jgi:hypothetical protein